MGQVSFTMDMWSDKPLRSYLAITAHWIARVKGTSALRLEMALVAFHQVCEDHTGESLANIVLRLLDRAGVTLKVRRQYSSCD